MRTLEPRRLLPAAGSILIASAHVIAAGAAGPGAGQQIAGSERWQGKVISYESSGPTRPDVRVHKGERDCRIVVTIDGRERTVVLKGEDIDVGAEHFDVGSYASVHLSAGRDFLIVDLVVTGSWGAGASGSANAQTTSGSSAASAGKTTRSASSGTSTDYLSLGFTELDGVPIRVRLKGGRAVACSIMPGSSERVIRFDIDKGKHVRTIAITRGAVAVDGVSRPRGPATPVLVAASKDSLSVTAGGSEIWARH